MLTDIITPKSVVFSDDLDFLIVPGTEGDIGILNNHSYLITSIRPGLVYGYKNERIIIHRAKINALPASDPGKVIKADKNEFLVSGIDQCVEIKELARQNKKRMEYKSFYNGSKDFFNSDESFK